MTNKTNSKAPHFEAKSVMDIGTLIFFKKFALMKVKEGVHLGIDEIQKLEIILSQYYKDKPYGYICDKANSYSVNPIGYRALNNISQLKCFAVIKEYSNSYDIQVEKHFIKKPFHVFRTFEEAVRWIESFI